MTTLVCALCAAPFARRPGRGRRPRFCSRVCRDRATHRRRRVARVPVHCATCGASTPRRRFCSRVCAAAQHRCACGARRAAQATCCRSCATAARQRPDAVCGQCARVYHPKSRRYRTFCSRACAFAAMHARRLSLEERRARARASDRARRVARPPQPCAHCGTAFVPVSRVARFCSAICCDRRHGHAKPRTFRCVVCAQVVTTTPPDHRRRFCSDRCRRFVGKRLTAGADAATIRRRWLYGQVVWFLLNRAGFEAHHGRDVTPLAL